MKLNSELIAPDGRRARLITQPIPGREKRLVVVQYADGHAAVVDLDACRTVEPQAQ